MMISKWNMNYLVDKLHQGLILDAGPITLKVVSPSYALTTTTHSLKDEDDQAYPVILACDEVQDPQNVGAILRSAYFLGITSILMAAKNTAALSPTVSRASAGALELLVHEVGTWSVVVSDPLRQND